MGGRGPRRWWWWVAAAWLHRLGLGARALAEVRRTEEVVGRKARTKEGRPGRRVVVVTAASENHAREVVGVVSTAQRRGHNVTLVADFVSTTFGESA